MTATKKIISALLVLAAAIGAGLALATFLPQNRQPVAQPPEILAPEYFWYLYNGSLGVGQDGSLPLLLENTAGNECMMQVRYTLSDGTVLLTTPVIGAGEYLLYAYPQSLPPAGSYSVTVSILVYYEGQDPAVDTPFAAYTEQATLTVPQGAALPQQNSSQQ